jgi:hypothetical protein
MHFTNNFTSFTCSVNSFSANFQVRLGGFAPLREAKSEFRRTLALLLLLKSQYFIRHMSTHTISLRTAALCAAAIPMLTLLPIILWRLNLPFISSTSGSEYRVFEIFAACITVMIVVVAAQRLRQQREPIETTIPTILFALLACYFVAQVTEYRPPSSDWSSYVAAAQAILAGANPYDDTGYLYPPMVALALAAVYQVAVWGSSLLQVSVTTEFVWQGVFYVYQCMQFFLVIGAVALCFRLAQALGATDLVAAVMVTVLFVFNIPVMRTLQFHQVNFWLLVLMLVAALFARSLPMVAGLSLAIATHVKLYGAILLLPFLLLKQLRVVLWAVLGIAAILFLQTAWGANPSAWRQYFEMAGAFPAGTMFRDNSVHSIVHNTLSFLNRLVHLEPDFFATLVRVVTLLATCGVLWYFGKRWRMRARSVEPEHFAGTLFDAIALALIISPLVWEHHYILALPFIIYVAVTRGQEQPWRVGIGTFLICAVPVFDLFPLSYHRVAGLLLLVSASVPHSADSAATERE